jgi:hypothetical protein
MLRSWLLALLLLLTALLSPPDPASAQSEPRVVAIGDLHGDFEAWRAIAAGAGLIDDRGRWSGGRTTLVQLGDITDRGPDSLKIIRDLMRLQGEAPRAGGRVVVVVGNHEAMMMTNDLRYVHPGEFAAFTDDGSKRRRDLVYEANRIAIEAAYRGRSPNISATGAREAWMKTYPLGRIEHQLAWAPNGELGRWAIANPAVVKIGDSLFVHGGISSSFADISIDDLNRRVAEALRLRDESPNSIINDPRGPLWYRGLVTRQTGDEAGGSSTGRLSALPPPTIDEEVELVTRAYGVKRIVVGHTPSLKGIVPGSNGKLWRADSGNSRAYGGTPSYLEIVGDRVVAHSVPRPAS